MSIIFEIYHTLGKKPCPPGALRAQRCPLILNPTSEDIFVANTFGLLKLLRPMIWFNPMFELAYAPRTISAPDDDRFSIEFWKKIHPPPAVSGYRMGVSEIDVLIRFLSVTVMVECKYRSPLKQKRGNEKERDQLLRYLDLAAYHFLSQGIADVFLLLLSNTVREPAILKKYKEPSEIESRLTKVRPHADYGEISKTLSRNLGWISWMHLLQILERIDPTGLDFSEKKIVQELIQYLKFKLNRPFP